MKAYVIYLPKSPKSVEAANVTIQTGRDIAKIDVELWEGFDRVTGPEKMKEIGYLEYDSSMSWGYSDVEAAIGTFFSHHSLWETSVRTNEHILILEHDAHFKSPLNHLDLYKNHTGVINIGKPQRGLPNIKVSEKWYENNKKPLLDRSNYERPAPFKTSARGIRNTKPIRICCLFGAHAYIVSPNAAKILIRKARERGMQPADLHIQCFGYDLKQEHTVEIDDCIPFTVHERSSFSLIQKIGHPFFRSGSKWGNKTHSAETAWDDYG